jgi:hypothetical protein
MKPQGQESKEEKSQRLVEAAMAILCAAPERKLKIVQLNKALFFLDLIWLRDHGTTATHQTYIALEQGPVVAKYPERLVGELARRGLARQTEEGNSKPVVALQELTSYSYFQAHELAKNIAEVFSRHTSKTLSDYSHDNPGWIAARTISKAGAGQMTAIDMNIALQHFSIDDDWLDKPADEQLEKAISEAAHTAIDI